MPKLIVDPDSVVRIGIIGITLARSYARSRLSSERIWLGGCSYDRNDEAGGCPRLNFRAGTLADSVQGDSVRLWLIDRKIRANGVARGPTDSLAPSLASEASGLKGDRW